MIPQKLRFVKMEPAGILKFSILLKREKQICANVEIFQNEKYVAKVLDKYIKMVYNKNVLRKVRSHTLLIPVDGCRCRHYEMDYETL